MITAKSRGKNYLTEITDGTHTFFSDSPIPDGGGDRGARPTDILAGALAACMNITARMVIDRMGLEYRTVTTYIDVDRDDPDNVIFKTKLVIDADFPQETKDLIAEKVSRCPVCRILRADKEFITME